MQFVDDEEEEQVQKIKIPKYKILYMDLDNKKDSELILNTQDKNDKLKKEENKKIVDRIWKCKAKLYYYF